MRLAASKLLRLALLVPGQVQVLVLERVPEPVPERVLEQVQALVLEPELALERVLEPG